MKPIDDVISEKWILDLDLVLEFLASTSNGKTPEEIDAKFSGRISPDNITIHMEKLIEDKLVYWHSKVESVNGGKVNRAYIKHNGIIKCFSGGYAGEIKRHVAENNRLENLETHQKRHQSYMTSLTVVLAVGILPTFYLALADLYWKYHFFQEWFSPKFATIALIITTIFLIIIALSVYLYPKAKKRLKHYG